jgi:hypothetical protein
MTSRLDLADVPLNQLLEGLATDAQPAPNPVDMWIQSAPLYPGSTRIRAIELYQEYVDFITQHQLGKPLALRVWGKYMTSKFKTGRGKSGIFYYISREGVVYIPLSLRPGG